MSKSLYENPSYDQKDKQKHIAISKKSDSTATPVALNIPAAASSNKNLIQDMLLYNREAGSQYSTTTYSSIIKKIFFNHLHLNNIKNLPYILIDIDEVYTDQKDTYYELKIKKNDKYYSLYIKVDLENLETFEKECSLCEPPSICVVTSTDYSSLAIEFETPIGHQLIEFELETLTEQTLTTRENVIVHNGKSIKFQSYTCENIK